MTQRSNTSSHVHKVAGPAIFGCTPEALHTSSTQYENFHSQIGWVLHEDGTSSYNTWAAEILHKDYNGYFNINIIFLNPKLIKVSMVLPQTYGSWLIVLVILCDNLWTKCCSETFWKEPLIHKLEKQDYGTSLWFDQHYTRCNCCFSHVGKWWICTPYNFIMTYYSSLLGGFHLAGSLGTFTRQTTSKTWLLYGNRLVLGI